MNPTIKSVLLLTSKFVNIDCKSPAILEYHSEIPLSIVKVFDMALACQFSDRKILHSLNLSHLSLRFTLVKSTVSSAKCDHSQSMNREGFSFTLILNYRMTIILEFVEPLSHGESLHCMTN